MRRYATLAIVVVLSASSSAALGQGGRAEQPQFPFPFPNMQGTPEEERACAPDANRFCREQGSNPLLVLGCLKSNRSQISTACRRVLESHGQ